METTVFCPDCGGVIGGDAKGRKPCICLVTPEGARPGMPDPVSKPKVCCKCQKDLEGKKRFKDSLGYWCEACHFSEKREEQAKHVPCDGCGRFVEPDKLEEYEGVHICGRCIRERKSEGRKKRRAIRFGTEHREYEKKTLMTVAIVATLLLLIIVLAWFGIL